MPPRSYRTPKRMTVAESSFVRPRQARLTGPPGQRWDVLHAEDRAADVDLLALLRAGVGPCVRPDRFLDRERGVADFPVFTLTPDPDPAAQTILVIAVVQLDDGPPARAQRCHRVHLADAEEIGPALGIRHSRWGC